MKRKKHEFNNTIFLVPKESGFCVCLSIKTSINDSLGYWYEAVVLSVSFFFSFYKKKKKKSFYNLVVEKSSYGGGYQTGA